MEALPQGDATVRDELRSESWSGAAPRVSVVIPTHQRAGYLREVLDALEHQTLGLSELEVIVCDDGSTDDTWSVLEERVANGALRLCAVRLPRAGGPGPARNAAAARARGEVLAFTDDDCLPTPGWLAALLAAFGPGVDIVQGAVGADPAELAASAQWDKTLWVSGPTPWFETANIAYRRELFERLGGFRHGPGVDPGPGPMAFGEDSYLGARALDAGAHRAFAETALVHHRCIPADFADHLLSRRRLAGFPALARSCPPIREHLLLGIFLTRRSAAFDLSLVGVALAILRRQPLWLLLAAWYVRSVWPDSRWQVHGPRARARRLVQLAYGDAVGFTWLVRGSARHRRPVL